MRLRPPLVQFFTLGRWCLCSPPNDTEICGIDCFTVALAKKLSAPPDISKTCLPSVSCPRRYTYHPPFRDAFFGNGRRPQLCKAMKFYPDRLGPIPFTPVGPTPCNNSPKMLSEFPDPRCSLRCVYFPPNRNFPDMPLLITLFFFLLLVVFLFR